MNELGMNYVALYRPVRAGGTGGASQIFASQLTLSQRGGTIIPIALLLPPPPGFSDLPTALLYT